jgi:peptidoglycan hydrolase-like protein with peptidoglycan-binding domain
MVVGRGLSRVSTTPTNSLIAYATQSGNVALDGSQGKHSPYASALIKHLGAVNKDVRLVFGSIRDEVIKATDRKQEPFTYGSLSGDAIFLNEVTQTNSPEKPDPTLSHLPQTQLETANAVVSVYGLWRSATTTDSWSEMQRITDRDDDSLFPYLAGKIVDVRLSDPQISLQQAINRLASTRLDFSRISGPAARIIQAYLRDLNYYGGTLDGVIGRDSRTALEAFNNEAGEPRDITYRTLLDLAQQAASRGAESDLTGRWNGRYYYPKPVKGIKSVEFEMDLTFSQGTVSGFIIEPNTFGKKTSDNLYANFNGSITGNRVEWDKTYDGTAGVSHTVKYVGTLDRRAKRIQGKWIISKGWSGDFNIAIN